jgi:hypothetical protein
VNEKLSKQKDPQVFQNLVGMDLSTIATASLNNKQSLVIAQVNASRQLSETIA